MGDLRLEYFQISRHVSIKSQLNQVWQQSSESLNIFYSISWSSLQLWSSLSGTTKITLNYRNSRFSFFWKLHLTSFIKWLKAPEVAIKIILSNHRTQGQEWTFTLKFHDHSPHSLLTLPLLSDCCSVIVVADLFHKVFLRIHPLSVTRSIMSCSVSCNTV